MVQWETQAEVPFLYRLFRSSDGTTIDLDDETLQALVELFVGAQLGFWQHINRLAQTRFPRKRVDRSDIEQVREFVRKRSDDFVRLFTEHIPHYLMLNHRPEGCGRCTQKAPHLRPNDHYADHLAVWQTLTGDYQVMLSEAKASEHYPRDLVRKSPSDPDKRSKGTMFDEFDEVERRQHDLFIRHQLLYDIEWSLLISSKEEAESLVESGFWKRDLVYHGCVVTSDSTACPGIFDGYEDVAAKQPDSPKRRWATVVPISQWQEWVNKITRMALGFLTEREAEGHF